MNYQHTHALLDDAHRKILNHEVYAGLQDLHDGLDELRERLSPREWKLWVAEVPRQHQLLDLMLQEPMTRHSFVKPRGYAGDASLMDFPYGNYQLTPDISPWGRDLYQANYQHAVCRSVRIRRDIMAAKIDEVAAAIERPRLLSIACGHLREAQISSAVRQGRIGEFIALDQDDQSLALVQREQAAQGVQILHGSVRSILSGKTRFADFDFVYSMGLYDYLSQPIARRMTALMFAMLRQGGRLIVANFAKKPAGAAYMESFMDWWLIHRDESEVNDFTAEIPANQIKAKRIFADEDGNVIYLELTK